MDVSIIVVNWNSREYLRRCLESIRLHASSQLRLEVVVIDSASYDGSEAMVREFFPEVRFIQSPTNLGFARGNNAAFRASTGESLLFLNPDTEVSGGAIETLHAKLTSDVEAGVVGPTLLNTDGSVQTTCIRSIPTIANRVLDSNLLRSLWPTCPLWGMAPIFVRQAGAAEVQALSGACMMLRRATFEEVGGFSDDYFMYAEDMDLCHKVRRAGYRNYYVPAATVVHHGGSSSQQAENRFAAVMMPEATWRFFRKTRGTSYALSYRVAMLASALGRLLLLQFVLPFQLNRERRQSWRASVRKWKAIARWSINKDDMVKSYYAKHWNASVRTDSPGA